MTAFDAIRNIERPIREVPAMIVPPSPAPLVSINDTSFSNYRTPAHANEVAWAPNRILQSLFQAIPSDYSLMTWSGKSKLEEEKGLGIFEEMNRDTQCRAALSVKAAAVKVSRWSITPYDDTPAAKEQADFLTFAFSELLGQRAAGFAPLTSAYDYGRASCEVVYELQTLGRWAGKYIPTRIKGKNPGFVSYEQDDYSNLTKIMVRNLGGQTRELDPRLMLHYAWDAQFENPYGRSDLISCYPWWWAKKTLYKYLMIFADKYASPIPVIEVDKPLTASQNTDLDAALNNYHISNYLKLPKGVKLDLFQNNGTAGSVYILAVREADSQMARGIFANTLTIGENNKTGTHAQAKVHAGTLKQILWANLLDLEHQVANRQLVKRLVDINFSNPKGYCKFRFWDLDPEDLLAMAEAIDLLVNQVDQYGNRTVDVTESWVRPLMNLPEKDLKAYPISKTVPDWLKAPKPAAPPSAGNKPMRNPTRKARPMAASFLEDEGLEEPDEVDELELTL